LRGASSAADGLGSGADTDSAVRHEFGEDAVEAIRLGRQVEALDIGWFEEPVPPEDIDGHRAQGLWTPWYRGVHLVVVLLLVRQNEVMLVRCDEIERPLNNLLVVGLGEVVNPPIPEDQID